MPAIVPAAHHSVMQRVLLSVLALVTCLAGGLSTAPAAEAVGYLYSGRIVTAHDHTGIAGVQVVADPPLGVPQVVAVTGADGSWAFGSTRDEFALYFNGGATYQSGWYDACSTSTFVQPAMTCTTGPGVHPTLAMFATWAGGRIVDGATVVGIANVRVEARAADGVTVLAATTTAADGSYRLTGLTGDEFGFFVNGGQVGYSSGFFGCGGTLVATWGAACTFAPGPQATRSLTLLLGPPRSVTAGSSSTGAITMSFKPPAVGSATGYQLTCGGLLGRPVTRTYTASGQTAAGFNSGLNSCTFRAVNGALLGVPVVLTISVR